MEDAIFVGDEINDEPEPVEEATIKSQDEFFAAKQDLMDRDTELNFSSKLMLSDKGVVV